jgi:hypothetical protein
MLCILLYQKMKNLLMALFLLVLSTSPTFGQTQNPEPTRTVVNFLEWYRVQHGRLNNIPMVNKIGRNNRPINYSINFKQTERYLSDLQRSGFISERYMRRWRAYFKECDENFKKNPIDDGPPDGLEFDLVMWSNSDYEEELAALDRIEVVESYQDKQDAIVVIKFLGGRKLRYTLLKERSRWKIAQIKNLGD